MITLLNIFPQKEFTRTEMVQIAEAISNPSLQAYLKDLAYKATIEIACTPQEENQSDAEYIRKQEQLRGSIAVVQTLLGIEKAEEPQEFNAGQ